LPANGQKVNKPNFFGGKVRFARHNPQPDPWWQTSIFIANNSKIRTLAAPVHFDR
jgi:hypothetical protein